MCVRHHILVTLTMASSGTLKRCTPHWTASYSIEELLHVGLHGFPRSSLPIRSFLKFFLSFFSFFFVKIVRLRFESVTLWTLTHLLGLNI